MNTNSSVPEAIRQAADRYRKRHPHRPSEPITRPVERGDIVVIRTDLHGGATSVAVVARRLDTHLIIWAVHAEPELATEWDAIVEPSDTGLGYRLVVQGDLAITCLEHRAIKFLGRTPAHISDAVGAVDATDGQSIRDLGQFHPQLGGPFVDRRWQHKEQELERVQPFQTEAIRTLWPNW